jgi:hypothetical protein
MIRVRSAVHRFTTRSKQMVYALVMIISIAGAGVFKPPLVVQGFCTAAVAASGHGFGCGAVSKHLRYESSRLFLRIASMQDHLNLRIVSDVIVALVDIAGESLIARRG